MEDGAAVIFLGVIGIVIYAPIVVICWCNIGFSQPWKAAFSLSVLPVIVVATLLTVSLADAYAPWLLSILHWAKEGDTAEREKLISYLFLPLAGFVAVAWYLFFTALDKASKFLASKVSKLSAPKVNGK